MVPLPINGSSTHGLDGVMRHRQFGYCEDMAAPVRKLIFDTSAINKLREDKDCSALLSAMDLVFHVGITGTVISEVVATKDDTEREALLNVLKRLLAYGSGLLPINWLIEQQAKAYQHDPKGYDWKHLNIRIKAAEDEIARQEFIHEASAETRRENKEWGKRFLQIFRDAQDAFEKLFIPSQERPSLKDVTEHLMGPGGAHREIGAGLIERATGTRPDDTTTQDFITRCPSFRALLVALCFTQYNMCVRDKKIQSLGKAGRNDMYSAVYLPYCKIFVTDDKGHHKAMKAVGDLAGLECAVMNYEEFKAGIVGIAL